MSEPPEHPDGADRAEPVESAEVGEPPGLAAIRTELDDIDSAIVDLIARRLDIVDAVGVAKAVTSAPVRDVQREQQVLAKVEAAGVARGVSGGLVRRVFREIVSHAVDRQVADLLPDTAEPVVVAYQGTSHTDGHLAARKFITARDQVATFEGQPTYTDAVAAVTTGRCHLAVVPVESTATGSISEVYDLLQRSGVAVVGEETLRLERALAARGDLALDRVTRVLSDASGLEACAAFLRGLPAAVPVACPDTSAAMRMVRDGSDDGWAAIGPPDAADAYGLTVLRHRIAEPVENYLRFLVLARDPVAVDTRIPSKTSVVLVTRHEDGALLKCLQILAVSGRSMTKLESRPLPGRPFEYLFFLDFEGNVADPATERVVDDLRSAALSVTVLGSYPAKVTRADAGLDRPATADGIEAVLVRPPH